MLKQDTYTVADIWAQLDVIYQELEDRYHPKIVNTRRHSTPVNFKEALAVPIHRWYNYKEGFSPRFVSDFIQSYSKSPSDVVFDPFGGVGTTTLQASIMGFKSYSTDVNPLGNFASRIKSKQYSDQDKNDIIIESERLKSIDSYTIHAEIPNKTVVGYFQPETYHSLLQIITYISDIKNTTTKNVFSLALLSLVELLSTHHKDGNGLKKKKKAPKPLSFEEVKLLLIDRIALFVDDISNVHIKQTPIIFQQSNIEKYELPQKADIVITSPPYANCFDYSKVYMNELWVGGFFLSKDDQTRFREQSITSHVHYRWKKRNEEFSSTIISDYVNPILCTKHLWSNSIPSMLIGYFSDMGKFLDVLTHNLNKNAVVGIVVGNSVYGGVLIPTDLIIASMAEEMGYSVEGIDVYRELSSSPQQMSLIKESDKRYLRESLVILRWKA